ncbi:hypothetical protein Q5530_10370 [Saccharothrix sp. BKS2]
MPRFVGRPSGFGETSGYPGDRPRPGNLQLPGPDGGNVSTA